jgi:hypothetical protein
LEACLWLRRTREFCREYSHGETMIVPTLLLKAVDEAIRSGYHDALIGAWTNPR